MTDKIILMSTCAPPDAARIARALVENGVAACVNIVDNVRSVYRWKGEISEDREAVLIIKSRRDLLERVKEELRQVHSYEVPELIALPVVDGLELYLNWIDESLRPPGT